MHKYIVPMELTKVDDKNATFAYAHHKDTINLHLMSRDLWDAIGKPHNISVRIENNGNQD